MFAGWLIALSAVLLLRAAGPQNAFVVAALAIEALGLVLLARTHLSHRGERLD
jgi:hypothetical protein